jgi:uncharacterized protein (DUF1501 family)
LSGGNDGLNTVVPFADDVYHKSRPGLRVEPNAVLKLDDAVGFAPECKGLKSLWDEGQVKVVQGVGYPDPSRSHFRSMEIWQSGVLDAGPTSGWLGATADRTAGLDLCHVGTEAVPLALRGRRALAQSIGSVADYRFDPGATLPTPPPAGADDQNDVLLGAVRSRYRAALDLAARVGAIERATSPAPAVNADNDPLVLEASLATVRTLIEADAPFRIYYTAQPGFDTHAAQKFTHARLLRGVSDAVATFLRGLRMARLDERVVVLIFSEFGRRLQENGSAGTDHGTSAPVILAGKPVRGGLVGPPPNLNDLDLGDPRFTTDFRDLYATVLRRWLAIDPTPILGRRDEALPLF